MVAKHQKTSQKQKPNNSKDDSKNNYYHFAGKLNKFLENTEKHTGQGANPGGYYKAIWCRDAAHILKDQFLSGNIQQALQQLVIIWSHQIEDVAEEKLVYGRGSPEMKFKPSVVKDYETRKLFVGALPTTIYQEQGFSEIYAKNPDIDSTSLMIATTSRILYTFLKAGLISRPTIATSLEAIANDKRNNNNHKKSRSSSKKDNNAKGDDDKIADDEGNDKNKNKQDSGIILKTISASDVIQFTVPRMIKAIDTYLLSRDIDNDGLLEQDHNEDWMDTVMRRGKIVYSQATFIAALKNLSFLLSEIDQKKEADRMMEMANKTIDAVDRSLWSEEDGAYIDMQPKEKHIGGPYRTLTQDVSQYLVAIAESPDDNLNNINQDSQLYNRAISTLDTMQKRIWKEKWPLVTEVELKKSGPWVLKPNQYHNHTFWPWTTGIEMLARSKFHRLSDCNTLFSKIASEGEPHTHALYEWLNPLTDKGEGAYPFKTGISAVRIAIFDVLKSIQTKG